ncbi:MAG: NAD(P)/FAD-dependent oxidoreductase [Phycisphaerales bacterium]|jgi:flavin-dependent dehydrogenase|nr:NAD(P)/FAD-dependent oxidoreductase [Phycisphaerales bacterium]
MVGISGTGNVHTCEVAIIGGGPAGSTTAALLMKYRPDSKVLVLEKEKFPRDHVGESQLPSISAIIDEMGCWDEIENAGFPLKIGATYRWGKNPELWNFDFAPPSEVEKLSRPTPYEGLRRQTAFQVDRAIYDEILLNHAEKLGAEIRQETQVTEVLRDGDHVKGLKLSDGSTVVADYYIDATGHVGTLRRAMGVETKPETKLQNVAFWDYWENADWAIEVGSGGTRVQVMSQAAGWIWFIPLGPTRTSIGYVVPSDHYKSLGSSVEDCYHEAIKNDDRISALIKNATPRGMVEATKDWSFTSERGHGENWFLVGESIGFADPILAAGMTLAHTGARELAHTLAELLASKENEEADWLKESLSESQLRRVRQHIRFADFWYASNGQFTDLQEHCAEIARESGIKMSPEAAWRWLAQGGFTNENNSTPALGTCDLPSLKQVLWKLTDKKGDWELNHKNVLKLNLRNAERKMMPVYEDGMIKREDCWVRGQNRLPMTGIFKVVVDILEQESRIDRIHKMILEYYGGPNQKNGHLSPIKIAVQAMEAMINEGWVIAKIDKKSAKMAINRPEENDFIHTNRDEDPAAPKTMD